MQDWISASIVAIITGVILLIIEYRTGYFANFKEEIQRRSSKPQPKPKQKFLQRLREQPNWAETIARARQNLSKIYGVHPDEIQLIDWRPDGNWLKKRLRLVVRIPTPTSKDGTPVDFYDDFHDELVHHILVDQEGQIIRDDWW